jgi:hypothetical protein
MFQKLKKIFKTRSRHLINDVSNHYNDFSNDDREIYNIVKPYTMTSPERVKVLLDALNYVVLNNIPGDYVECGVWKGGSSLAVSLMLEKLSNYNINLWLFDTFSGMSKPTSIDVDNKGNKAAVRLENEDKITSSVWAYSELDEVKSNMGISKFPKSNIKYIKGKVEDTLLMDDIPEQISILRLDTDWFESTKIELEILYPKLVKGGIIIIDDYGHWKGSKKAVDEYLNKNNIKVFLHRIDYTARLFVKP